MDIRQIFMGVEWMGLIVEADGSINPPAHKSTPDKVRVVRAFYLGPNVYSVVNFTKLYQCFVQFKREGYNKFGRCNHTNCHWQSEVLRPKPCKHLRAACKHHVKLMRRVGRLSASEALRAVS